MLRILRGLVGAPETWDTRWSKKLEPKMKTAEKKQFQGSGPTYTKIGSIMSQRKDQIER